jgi:NHLM bacteriocin system ABC transporter ATP-binding protein
MTSIADAFRFHGEKIEMEATFRVILHDVDSLLFVEEGDVDIFLLKPAFSPDSNFKNEVNLATKSSRPLQSHFLVGGLTFLMNVSSTQLIFPFPLSDYYVIAIANTETTLRKLSLKRFKEICDKEQIGPENLNEISRRWLNSFSPLFQSQVNSLATYYLEDDFVKTHLPANSSVARNMASKGRPLWIQTEGNPIQFFGLPKFDYFPNTSPFPLVSSIWFVSQGDVEITAVLEESWLTSSFWQGLLAFNGFVQNFIGYKLFENLQNEKIALKNRQETDSEILNAALRRIGSVMMRFSENSFVDTANGVLRACQSVAKAVKLPFIDKIQFRAQNILEQVYEAATKSNIYQRKILLKEQWWKKGGLPFVGFVGDAAHPLATAIIPNEQGQYEIVDSFDSDKKTKITDEIAKHLSHFGVVFYRAFPEKMSLRAKEIIKFCLDGRYRDLLTVILTGLVGIVLSLFLPIFNKVLFDDIIPNNDFPLLFQIILGLIVFALSAFVFSVIQELTLLRLETLIDHDMQSGLWQKVLSLPVSFFRKFTAGDLIQRLSAVNEVRKSVTGYMVRVIMDGIFAPIYLFLMLYYSPILTFVAIGFLLIFTLFDLVGLFITLRYTREIQTIKTQLSGKVIQIIFGIPKIRTNGSENRIFAFWAQQIARIKNLETRAGITQAMLAVGEQAISSLGSLLMFMTVFLILPPTNDFNSRGGISLGTYLAFSSAFGGLSAAFSTLSGVLRQLISNIPLLEITKPIFTEPKEDTSQKLKIEKFQGSVRVDHIYFRYNVGSPLVHEDISLYAEPGEFIALVGPSGCGKSSLLRLLLGFETPEQGAIYFDGKDVKDLDSRDLRSQFGVILQHSMILDGTIRENISGGRFVTDDEILEATRKARFDEDLARMPMGLNTPLTSGAPMLSGGQRQRLMIARALLGNPRLLLMDEATNALDNRTQQAVSKNLDELHVTRVVVAHRLSTVRNANRIYVFDKGRIAQCGTFNELASQEGIFASLVNKQKL